MPASDDQQLSALRKAGSRTPALVKVPPIRYLQIEGGGDVGSEPHREAVSALYGLAYPVKFAARKRLQLGYQVAPLEGIYWHEGDSAGFDPTRRGDLLWRLLISLPDEVSSEFVEEVRAKVAAKKQIARLGDVCVQTLSEGTSVQLLHTGAYSDEGPTIAHLKAFAKKKGYVLVGRHHEIYLGDPNREPAEKRKTTVRYPVGKPRR